MDTLYNLLEENIELYNNFLELECKKYDAVLKADTITLDGIVSKEQACYMKMRGFEQKRVKTLEELGLKDKTLKEIIELSEHEQKMHLTIVYDELNKLITDIKRISNLCKAVIEVRMHRVEKLMDQLGEKDNTQSKNLILSKKI